MNNYQLYRTNVALGGQMKWDLVLTNTLNELQISDFHLSPISSNIPFVYNQNDYLLNNYHKDNVKNFYNSIKPYFYKECLDSTFNNTFPIIGNEAQYSNMYDMKCNRSKSFSRYNKQFEFFCPVWITKLDGIISFVIEIKNYDNGKVISSNTLKLENGNNSQHNKFVNYFNNYINDTNLNIGDDNILNISFRKNTSTINGLNVSNGILETIKDKKLIKNLLLTERPLLETDYLLLKIFEQNNLICKNLFNFNICFNITDIVSRHIEALIQGKRISISVSVCIDDIPLEKVDFYTNYESILNNSTNVLDYLYDYKYIQNINKNKFSQSICHWVLDNNENHIFNVYKGFDKINYETVNDIKPIKIKIDKTLKYGIASSPSNKSTEITYYTNNKPIIINRYDGKVKPMFVKSFNNLYYKNTINQNDSNNNIYSNENYLMFNPVYPSINYCGIGTLQQNEWSYDNLPSIINENNLEYTWFNTNRFIVLASTINKSVLASKDNDSIENIINGVLMDFYDIDEISKFYNTTKEDVLKYISSKYICTNNWLYESDDNIDKIICNITLSLK